MAATSLPAVAETILFTGSAGRIASADQSGINYTILQLPNANPLFFRAGGLARVSSPDTGISLGASSSTILSVSLLNPTGATFNPANLTYTGTFGEGGDLLAAANLPGLGGRMTLETATVQSGVFNAVCNNTGCSNGTGFITAELTNVEINPAVFPLLGITNPGPYDGVVTISMDRSVAIGNGTTTSCFPASGAAPPSNCDWRSTSMNFVLENTPAEVPGEIPLPAALPLFAGGLGVLGLLGRRRSKRKVSAAS
jgi:hypothetical protein